MQKELKKQTVTRDVDRIFEELGICANSVRESDVDEQMWSRVKFH